MSPELEPTFDDAVRARASRDLRVLGAITIPALVWWYVLDPGAIARTLGFASAAVAAFVLLAPRRTLEQVSLPLMVTWQIAVPVGLIAQGNGPGLIFSALIFGAVSPLPAPWREAVVGSWFLGWFVDHSGPDGTVDGTLFVPLALMAWATMAHGARQQHRAWEDQALLRRQSLGLALQRDQLESAVESTRSELLAQLASEEATARWVMLGRIADGLARELEAPLREAQAKAAALPEELRGPQLAAIQGAVALVDDLMRVAAPPTPIRPQAFDVRRCLEGLEGWKFGDLPDSLWAMGSEERLADILRRVGPGAKHQLTVEVAPDALRLALDCPLATWTGDGEAMFEPFSDACPPGISRLTLAAVRSDVLAMGAQVHALPLARGGTRMLITLARAPEPASL